MLRRSIKWRFILPFVILLVMMGTALTIFFSNRYTNSYYEDTRDLLTAEANLLAGEISLMPPEVISNSSLQELATRFATQLNSRVTIILPDGVVAAESEADPALLDNHLYRPEVQQALAMGSGYNVRYSTTRKTQMIYVAVRQERDGELERIVRLSKPLAVVETRVKNIRSVILLGSLGTILLTILVLWLAARRTLKPLTDLTKAANRIATGDYSDLPVMRFENELSELTRAFTRMSRQIKSQLDELTGEKAKLEKIVDRLMDGIIIITKTGQIDLMNRAAGMIFGVDANKAQGGDFIELIQNYQVVELWQQTLASGKDMVGEINLKQTRKYLLGLTTFLGTVKEGTVLLLLQDRTQNRLLEEMRQTFVSNVSHELRTPLTTMKALNETLQECVDADLPSARRFIGLLDVEIDKLTQMVLELLDLSRIESGRAEMNKVKTSVLELLQSSVRRMKAQADRAGLNLSVDCPSGLPDLYVDGEQLERVLMNLIHNSIKHTLMGGSIVVSAAQSGDQMVIKVKDTGEGISSKDLPRIFERFYKTDQARASGGTGLGLAIAKHIVEAHGGTISAESQQGEGATFIISLPLT